VRGQAFHLGTQLFRQNGPKTWKLHRGIRPVPRDRIVRTLRVVDLLAPYGTDDRQLVHVFGGARQQLGDLNPWRLSRNWPECACGFRIPSIDVTGSAAQPKQNARLGFSGPASQHFRLLHCEQVCGADAEKAERSCLEKCSPIESGRTKRLAEPFHRTYLLMVISELA
jgi:hypothetical protein